MPYEVMAHKAKSVIILDGEAYDGYSLPLSKFEVDMVMCVRRMRSQ